MSTPQNNISRRPITRPSSSILVVVNNNINNNNNNNNNNTEDGVFVDAAFADDNVGIIQVQQQQLMAITDRRCRSNGRNSNSVMSIIATIAINENNNNNNNNNNNGADVQASEIRERSIIPSASATLTTTTTTTMPSPDAADDDDDDDDDASLLLLLASISQHQPNLVDDVTALDMAGDEIKDAYYSNRMNIPDDDDDDDDAGGITGANTAKKYLLPVIKSHASRKESLRLDDDDDVQQGKIIPDVIIMPSVCEFRKEIDVQQQQKQQPRKNCTDDHPQESDDGGFPTNPILLIERDADEDVDLLINVNDDVNNHCLDESSSVMTKPDWDTDNNDGVIIVKMTMMMMSDVDDGSKTCSISNTINSKIGNIIPPPPLFLKDEKYPASSSSSSLSSLPQKLQAACDHVVTEVSSIHSDPHNNVACMGVIPVVMESHNNNNNQHHQAALNLNQFIPAAAENHPAFMNPAGGEHIIVSQHGHDNSNEMMMPAGPVIMNRSFFDLDNAAESSSSSSSSFSIMFEFDETEVFREVVVGNRSTELIPRGGGEEDMDYWMHESPLIAEAEVITDEEIHQRIHFEILQDFVEVKDIQPIKPPFQIKSEPDDDDDNDDDNQVLPKKSKKSPTRIVCIVISVMLLLVAAVVVSSAVITVGVISSRKETIRQPSPPMATYYSDAPSPILVNRPIATPAPSPMLRMETFRELLLNNSVSTVSALFNVSSPQYQALNWLFTVDQVTVYETSHFDIMKERFIVATLYFATKGQTWSKNILLMSGEGTCDWRGMSCDSNNRIQELRLPYDELQGTIPPEIGQLTHLQVLDLRGNHLNGGGVVTGSDALLLRRLLLDINRPILNNDYHVDGNLLTVIGMLTNLQTLLLSGTSLSGTLPTEIGRLQQLTNLQLAFNTLSGLIPNEIWLLLTNLVTLDLSSNNFAGSLATDIGGLQNLTALDISINMLSGPIPSELWTLTNLRTLNLGLNNLNGTLHTRIGGLQNITLLKVENNKLAGTIPSEVGMLSNLQSLDLSVNDLEGILPTDIGRLQQLSELDVSFNRLGGTICSEIGNLTALRDLAVDDNLFTGFLPTEVEMLLNLSFLSVSYNRFCGPLPSGIGSLADLESLYLQSNRFSGYLPPSIGKLRKLEELDVSANLFHGTVPTELVSLMNQVSPTGGYLNLSLNYFTGDLTPIFCNRTKPIFEFAADCLTKQVICPCCTMCCDFYVAVYCQRV